MSKPPITATLTWDGGLRFHAVAGSHTIPLDGDSQAGASPVEALALALAGCMAIDVADIVTKGRHPLTALEARISGERAADPPRRFTKFTLQLTVTGAVPVPAVERAIQLSRDKYCSVWHSFRQDIAFDTTFEVAPAP